MSLNEDKVLVLELGSHELRYTLGINEVSHTKYETILGYLGATYQLLDEQSAEKDFFNANELFQDEKLEQGYKNNELYLGDKLKDFLEINQPKENGNNCLEYDELQLFKAINWDGKVDWVALKYIITHLLEMKLNHLIVDNELSVLLIYPTSFSKFNLEELIKLSFDDLNFQSIYALPSNLATIYGYGLNSGLIVEANYDFTTVSVILDHMILPSTILTGQIGSKQLDQFIFNQLVSNNSLISIKSKQDADINLSLKLVTQFREKGILNFNIIEQSDENEINEELEIDDLKITLPTSFTHLPLQILTNSSFNPNLIELISNCLTKCDMDKVPSILENIAITGTFSNNQGLLPLLDSELTSKLVAVSDNIGYSQPPSVKLVEIPPYFRNLKEHPHLMAIVGGVIVAKGIFSDPKLYLTQNEFNTNGSGSLF